MTREDAIHVLILMKMAGGGAFENTITNDALDIAIRAMREYEPESDGCNGCKYEHNAEDVYPCNMCKNNYMSYWTADDNRAERKGKWIEIEDDEGERCSVCGKVFGAPYHYCPNCGARMEEHDD